MRFIRLMRLMRFIRLMRLMRFIRLMRLIFNHSERWNRFIIEPLNINLINLINLINKKYPLPERPNINPHQPLNHLNFINFSPNISQKTPVFVARRVWQPLHYSGPAKCRCEKRG